MEVTQFLLNVVMRCIVFGFFWSAELNSLLHLEFGALEIKRPEMEVTQFFLNIVM